MEFSKVLRTLRKQRKLSQAGLAKALSLDKSTVSLYESGKREPGYAMLARLADFFGVSADYLIGRADEQSVTPAHVRDIAEAAKRMDTEAGKRLARFLEVWPPAPKVVPLRTPEEREPEEISIPPEEGMEAKYRGLPDMKSFAAFKLDATGGEDLTPEQWERVRMEQQAARDEHPELRREKGENHENRGEE